MIDYLQKLLKKAALTRMEAEEAMDLILGEADPHQVAAFLALLKYRGESPEEIAGMVTALEKRGVAAPLPGSVLDIVGTGGDCAHTVNISTGAAILAAACGIPIAKHGNRSVSSKSGSADVLEALGIKIEIPPEMLPECLERTNLAFLFAPYYHPSFKKLAPIRKGLKLPTVFNLLGPLLNPAKAEYLLIGTASESALELLSDAALHLAHIKRALIFHGCGLDELTPLGKIAAYEIRDGKKERIDIDPLSLGFAPCTLKELQGGDAVVNGAILEEVFKGKPCAVADALILTAGAALYIYNSTTLMEGIKTAREALTDGKAMNVLENLRRFSDELLK